MNIFFKIKQIISNLNYKLGISSYLHFIFNPLPKNLSKQRKNEIRYIKSIKVRYQPIILPENIVIPKRCSATIIDSYIKLKKLGLPKNLTGMTVLDIGCSEGFFCIESARRGAKMVLGIEPDKTRVEIANLVKKAWEIKDRVKFKNIRLEELRPDEKFDIVFCFSVVHHYHGRAKGRKFLDTWTLLTNKKYRFFYKNMIKMVKKVALHTRKITYWEYPFTYVGYKTRAEEVNFTLLGRKWVEEGIYKKVDFLGFSDRNPIKDRALYKAYK